MHAYIHFQSYAESVSEYVYDSQKQVVIYTYIHTYIFRAAQESVSEYVYDSQKQVVIYTYIHTYIFRAMQSLFQSMSMIVRSRQSLLRVLKS